MSLDNDILNIYLYNKNFAMKTMKTFLTKAYPLKLQTFTCKRITFTKKSAHFERRYFP